jgi:hypothetical protein
MAKQMEAITIETDKDGMIRISQPDFGDGGNVLIVHPDQIEILCQWLKEERDKIKGKG